MSQRRREIVFGIFLLLPCFLFITAFAFFPIAKSFYLSLHKIVLSLPGLGSPYIGLSNFRALAGDRVALRSLINTFLFVGISTFFEILFGLAIALIINKKFPARGVIRASVLVPWAIPTVVSSQMWRFIFNDKYGLANFLLYGSHVSSYRAWLADPFYAFLAIVIADVWKTTSFAALIILAGLQLVPEELYAQASIDGATPLKRFWLITFPIIRPAVLIALLFRTMDAFRVFDLVFVMTQGGPADSTNVLQYYGYKKIFAEGLMGYGSAISVLVFVISFLVSLLYLRMLGKGVFQGVMR